MTYLISIMVNGLLAGTIYALIALSFVVVYKSSRMINFAVGEWAMLGSLLVATGIHVLTIGLAAAIVMACTGMILFASAFGHVVLRRLVNRPLSTMIMITLGLGLLMRGMAAIVFQHVPGAIPLPVASDPLIVLGVIVPVDKLISAGVAALCIAIVSGFYRVSRTGLALRAIADDPPLAMSMGIDVQKHFIVVWSIAGVIAVIGGVTWTWVAGGGIGAVLVGLKIFPIVIVGGADSVAGTIVAAMIIGLVESLSTGYLDASLGAGFSTVVCGVVLIVALLIRPRGLFGGVDVGRL